MRFSVKKSSYSSKQFVFQVRSSYFKLVVGESVVGKLVVGKSVVGESVVGESVVRKSFDVCPLILIPMTEYHDVCPLILIPMTEYCISYDSAIKKIKRSTEKIITTINNNDGRPSDEPLVQRLRRQKQGGWESRACFLFSIFYDSKSMLNWRTLLLLLRAAVPATEEFSHGTESWRLLSRTCNSGVE